MSEFSGFTVPKGAWLPPEFFEILPDISTMAEIKVVIAALGETMRIGGSEAIISLTDFETLTGLARDGVLRGIRACVSRKTLIRKKFGRTYTYHLNVKDASSSKIQPHDMLSISKHGDKNIENRTCHVVAEMRKLGVALHVCRDLESKHDPVYLLEKLEQVNFALEHGLARNGPGYFVASIRDGWGPPRGYGQKREPKSEEEERQERHQRYKGEGTDWEDIIQS